LRDRLGDSRSQLSARRARVARPGHRARPQGTLLQLALRVARLYNALPAWWHTWTPSRPLNCSATGVRVEYNDEAELTRYVWNYYGRLMTEFEQRVGWAHLPRPRPPPGIRQSRSSSCAAAASSATRRPRRHWPTASRRSAGASAAVYWPSMARRSSSTVARPAGG
jgi:hypothetical protein